MNQKPNMLGMGAVLVVISILGFSGFMLNMLFTDTQMPILLKFLFIAGFGGVAIILVRLIIERLKDRKDEQDDINNY